MAMFNEERKALFISESLDEYLQKRVNRVFDTFEPYEKENNLDLCEMPIEMLQPVFDKIMTASVNGGTNYKAIIKKYTEWCSANGYKTSGEYSKIKFHCADKVKNKMVGSASELKEVLDVKFRRDNVSIFIIYKCFFWLAYMGISYKDSVRVRVQDVNFKNMTVTFDGAVYDIPEEAYEVFHNACFSENLVSHKSRSIAYLKRTDGDLVLRGCGNSKTDAAKIRKLANNKALISGDDFSLTYVMIFRSGCYARMYEHQVNYKTTNDKSFKEEFNKELERLIHEQAKKQSDVIAEKSRQTALRNFRNWKKVFRETS